MLEIKNLYKEYKSISGKSVALKNISLTFKKGELVAIVGKSGSGKTTLLNIIAGLLEPSAGEITYEGENLCKLKGKQLDDYRRKHIGIILQNFSLLNDRDAYQNVELPLKIRGIGKDERAKMIKPLFEQLGIEHRMNSFPSDLSGGEKQRVAIARALVCDADIILADEPTGALDESNAAQIMELLKKIAADGKIVIMVTHDLKLAAACDRSITISEGEIV